MAKKTINSAGSKPNEIKKKDITALAEQVIFTPTPRQRKVKAQFWSRFQPGPFVSPSALTINDIQSVVNVAALKEWWADGLFKEWFMNREEAREKLEYLFMKALETAEEILENPEAQASAKVNMIKVIGELANKFPSKWQEKFADEDINKMSEAQLKAYLEKQGVTVHEEKIIEIEDSSVSSGDTSDSGKAESNRTSEDKKE